MKCASVLCLLLAATACDADKDPAVANAAAAPTKSAAAEAKAKVPAPAVAKAAPAETKAPDPKPPADPPPKPRAAFPELPPDAVSLELDMLGGKLKVPKGAKTGRNINGWQEIAAGKNFKLVVREHLDGLDAARKELGEVTYVVEEPDTLVYENGGAFGFVAVVEAKGPPELEGEADRTFECRAGTAMEWAVSKSAKGFPRAAVDAMVSACRSLTIS